MNPVVKILSPENRQDADSSHKIHLLESYSLHSFFVFVFLFLHTNNTICNSFCQLIEKMICLFQSLHNRLKLHPKAHKTTVTISTTIIIITSFILLKTTSQKVDGLQSKQRKYKDFLCPQGISYNNYLLYYHSNFLSSHVCKEAL